MISSISCRIKILLIGCMIPQGLFFEQSIAAGEIAASSTLPEIIAPSRSRCSYALGGSE